MSLRRSLYQEVPRLNMCSPRMRQHAQLQPQPSSDDDSTLVVPSEKHGFATQPFDAASARGRQIRLGLAPS